MRFITLFAFIWINSCCASGQASYHELVDAEKVVSAINYYRCRHGSAHLQWNMSLARTVASSAASLLPATAGKRSSSTQLISFEDGYITELVFYQKTSLPVVAQKRLDDIEKEASKIEETGKFLDFNTGEPIKGASEGHKERLANYKAMVWRSADEIGCFGTSFSDSNSWVYTCWLRIPFRNDFGTSIKKNLVDDHQTVCYEESQGASQLKLLPWITVGMKFRSPNVDTFPKTSDGLETLSHRLWNTLLKSWPHPRPQPFTLSVTLICPLIQGLKPSGARGEELCHRVLPVWYREGGPLNETSKMRQASVLDADPKKGFFAEVLMHGETSGRLNNEVDSLRNVMNDAITSRSTVQSTALDNLEVMPIPFADGKPLAVVQSGSAFTLWDYKSAQEWEEPEPDSSVQSTIAWWIWLMFGACGMFALVGIVTLLAVKRPKNNAKGSVTVSDFYRCMPQDACHYTAPIPEEHYCVDDGVASSVELESNRSLRDLGFGFVQPVGRI